MSNEQVILEMVINRLAQLLEGSQELKAKWSAEITEIILLGKGVLVATPQGRQDGKWALYLDDEESLMLYDILNHNSSVYDYHLNTLAPIIVQLGSMDGQEP